MPPGTDFFRYTNGGWLCTAVLRPTVVWRASTWRWTRATRRSCARSSARSPASPRPHTEPKNASCATSTTLPRHDRHRSGRPHAGQGRPRAHRRAHERHRTGRLHRDACHAHLRSFCRRITIDQKDPTPTRAAHAVRPRDARPRLLPARRRTSAPRARRIAKSSPTCWHSPASMTRHAQQQCTSWNVASPRRTGRPRSARDAARPTM